jgi:hypothetical protein
MSAFGQDRKSQPGVVMSASLPTADMRRQHRHVGFVPSSDITAEIPLNG